MKITIESDEPCSVEQQKDSDGATRITITSQKKPFTVRGDKVEFVNRHIKESLGEMVRTGELDRVLSSFGMCRGNI